MRPGHDPAPKLARGLAWLGLCLLCWGPMLPVAKRTLPLVDSFTLGAIRYLVGGTVFIVLLAAIEGRAALSYGARMRAAVIFGVIGITGFNGCVWYGLYLTRPEHAAIIMALQSPLTALAVWLTRGQRPARFTAGCIAAAILGVLLVVTRGDPRHAFAGGTLAGDGIVLLGAIAWVVYTLAGAHFSGWSPLRLTALTCIPGGIGLAVLDVIAVSSGLVPAPTLAGIESAAWQIAYFSFGTVVLGVLSFNFSVRYLGPLNTMLMLNLVPVTVFAIEASLGRRFAPIELAGGALVVMALAANNLYLRRRAAAAG